MIFRILPYATVMLFTACEQSSQVPLDPMEPYYGTWELVPMSEQIEDQMSELVAMAGERLGEMENSAEEREEWEAMSEKEQIEKLKPMLMYSMEMMDRIQLTLEFHDDGRYVSTMDFEGVPDASMREEEIKTFEVTETEILVRGDDETEVIYINPPYLEAPNQPGKIPKRQRFRKVEPPEESPE